MQRECVDLGKFNSRHKVPNYFRFRSFPYSLFLAHYSYRASLPNC